MMFSRMRLVGTPCGVRVTFGGCGNKVWRQFRQSEMFIHHRNTAGTSGVEETKNDQE
jgi:hypothetical protein